MSSYLHSPGPGVCAKSGLGEGPAERRDVFVDNVVDTVADATSPEPIGSPLVSIMGVELPSFPTQARERHPEILETVVEAGPASSDVPLTDQPVLSIPWRRESQLFGDALLDGPNPRANDEHTGSKTDPEPARLGGSRLDQGLDRIGDHIESKQETPTATHRCARRSAFGELIGDLENRQITMTLAYPARPIPITAWFGAKAGLENMLSVRGTEGSNPSPSSGESDELSTKRRGRRST
jgi:hypothetical protein